MHSKSDHQQTEKEIAEWKKKIFANHIADKGLIYKMHKEYIQQKTSKKKKSRQKNISIKKNRS